MSRRVQFANWGDIDQLKVVEVADPHPEAGQVRVRVRFAGLNPVDWKILASGGAPFAAGLTLPAGNGNDFSGQVDEIGDGVTELAVGDLVYGGARFEAQADYLVIDAHRLHKVPAGLGLDVAGGLLIAAQTAVAGVRAVAPRAGETVYVSGAAGGVGILAAQLARSTGARVLGTSSPENFEVLHALDIEPIAYGEGLADRLRAAAPDGIHAAYSTRDLEDIRLLLGVGVPADRIDAIAAGPDAANLGVHTAGSANAQPTDLDQVAHAIASGDLVSPIDSVYALEDVQAAYHKLKAGHLTGKIVLRTGSAAEARGILAS